MMTIFILLSLERSIKNRKEEERFEKY